MTGGFNYQKHGEAIRLDKHLIEDPELANDSEIASRLLASFIKSKEGPIRPALEDADLKKARELVNGGSHGLEWFAEAYRTGEEVIVGESDLTKA